MELSVEKEKTRYNIGTKVVILSGDFKDKEGIVKSIKGDVGIIDFGEDGVGKPNHKGHYIEVIDWDHLTNV